MNKGRPKKNNSKNKNFRVRLTEEEYKLLDLLSKETGKSKSDILRGGIKMNEIKIKYFSNEIDKLEFIEGDKSDWIDLRVC